MAQPTQRSGGKPSVQPNTLSGEAEPNTLSTMRAAPLSGRSASASGRQAPAWTTPRRPAASGPRSATGPMPGRAMLRLAAWIVFIVVFLMILSQSGR